jgi:eukaryotic-like serine/threonine-protein kinase
MGVVYDAYDHDRGTRVALKALHSLSAATIGRLKSEFRALQGFVHPNLVAMGELLEVDGTWFFTMELVEGVDFLDHVRPADGTLDEARLRDAAGQLARALVAVHAAGMVHRDVKPSNVRVTPQGRVVLLDFGLVRDARADHGPSSEVVGTVAYMAPEQAFGADVTPAADWYAFGALLYEALTGALPHDATTPIGLLAAKQQAAAPPPRARWPDVPADLDRLCEELLAIAVTDRPTGEQVLARLGAASDPDATTPAAAPLAPCLGRDRELAVIAAAFDQIRDGGAHAVWIHGASGVGKTTLVAHAAAALAARVPELLVLSGRCHERESVPYKALDGVVDALAEALRRVGERAASFAPLHAALLPSLFPALGRVPAIAAAPPPRTPLRDLQDVRRRAFAALRELFVRLALVRPLVVTIDDVQWADADSRLLLSEIIRPPEPPPLLLVLASRSAGAATAAPALLSALDRMPLTPVPLAPLEPEPATALARLLLDTLADGRAGADPEALAREAGGHPLFLAELARHASAEGSSRAPLRLDDAIVARAAGLPPDARQLLELVCVAGAPLAQAVARDADGLAPDDFDRQVARLRAVYLVRTSGARARDPIEPYHDRVRESVAAALAADVRRHRHARLAAALETATVAGDQASLLVRHWDEAGEPERAARHAREAAARARDALAFDRAAALLGDALRLGTYGDGDRRILHVERAQALANAGRSAEAADAFLAAAADAAPGERVELERLAAENYLISGRLEAGLELLGALLAHVGTSLPATPARGLRSLVWHRLRIALRGTRFRARRLDEIPREALVREDVFKTVSHGLGMVDSIRGADFQARNLLASLRAGDPARVAAAIGREVIFRASQGGRGLRSAERLARKLDPIAERTGDPLALAWRIGTTGILAYFDGRFGDAHDPLERADAGFAEHTVGTIWERNTVRLFRMFSARQAGALRALRELYEDTVRDAERRGDRYVEGSARRALNRVWLAAGDPARARAELARAAWLPPDGRFHLQHWWELEAGGELALYEGDPAPARAALEANAAALGRSLLLRIQIVRVLHLELHARLLVADAATVADPEPTRRHAERLVRRLAGERVAYATVYGLIVRAAVAAQRGRTDAAAATLREALALAAGTHQALHAAACRARLADLVGGAEGAALRAEADAWLSDEKVADPARMIALITPGFAPSADRSH